MSLDTAHESDAEAALAGLPATFALATQLPPAAEGTLGDDTEIDEKVDDLKRLYPVTFEHGSHDVLVVVNGTDEPHGFDATARSSETGETRALVIPCYPGCAYVVVDDTPVATLSPEGGEWFFDPFESGQFGPEHPVGDVEWFLLEAFRGFLVERGFDFPPVSEIVGDRVPPDAEPVPDGGEPLPVGCYVKVPDLVDDGKWHASIRFDGYTHELACGRERDAGDSIGDAQLPGDPPDALEICSECSTHPDVAGE